MKCPKCKSKELLHECGTGYEDYLCCINKECECYGVLRYNVHALELGE